MFLVVGGFMVLGKMGLVICLVQYFFIVIFLVDSCQFYYEMIIGNVWFELEELEVVQYYFIVDCLVECFLSVGEFVKEVLLLLDKLFQVYDYVVLVGGLGLFVRVLMEGLDEFFFIILQVCQCVDIMFEQGGVVVF